MTQNTERLLAESLSLPTSARGRRAARLLASLQPVVGTPSELKAAWDEELGRRLASVDAGETLDS